jgi:hypothetical protein
MLAVAITQAFFEKEGVIVNGGNRNFFGLFLKNEVSHLIV